MYKEHIRNIKLNKDESAFAQHILNKRNQYGPITEIMEMVQQANKGNLMIMKEHFYIYYFNIEEQKYTEESDNRNSMSDIIIQHQYTPTQTSQGLKV
jgi:hypothetical protein